VDLKRLRYFCAIIEQGSISKAAQVLCMAQPPLSKRLQELEEEVGTGLIVRSGRRLEPTEAGQFLYQRACEILRTVEDAKQQTIAIANLERRVLRVGVSYLFARRFFPVIQELYQRNPRAEISVSVSDSSQLEYLLQRGQIDIAFIQRPRNPEGFDLIDFAPIGLKALISTSLMAQQPSAALSLEELGHYPLILMRRMNGAGTFETILDHLRKAGVHPDVKMHVSDPCMAIEMLESGTPAVVFLPESEAIPSPRASYHVLEVFPNPLVFIPVAAKLSTGIDLPEVNEIIADFRTA
jgi:LysR family transcriptional regulator, salicylic acid-responsive activator of bsdBCD